MCLQGVCGGAWKVGGPYLRQWGRSETGQRRWLLVQSQQRPQPTTWGALKLGCPFSWLNWGKRRQFSAPPQAGIRCGLPLAGGTGLNEATPFGGMRFGEWEEGGGGVEGWEEGGEGLGTGWEEDGGGFQAPIAVIAPGGWGDVCLGPEQGPWWWISTCTPNTLGSALCNIFTPSGNQASSSLTGFFLCRNFKRKVSEMDNSWSWSPPAPTTHPAFPSLSASTSASTDATWWQAPAPEPHVLPPARPAPLRLCLLCMSTVGICQGSTHATIGHPDGEQILPRCPG